MCYPCTRFTLLPICPVAHYEVVALDKHIDDTGNLAKRCQAEMFVHEGQALLPPSGSLRPADVRNILALDKTGPR